MGSEGCYAEGGAKVTDFLSVLATAWNDAPLITCSVALLAAIGFVAYMLKRDT